MKSVCGSCRREKGESLLVAKYGRYNRMCQACVDKIQKAKTPEAQSRKQSAAKMVSKRYLKGESCWGAHKWLA